MSIDFLTLLRGATTHAPRNGMVRFADATTAYGLAALENEADAVRSAPQGTRNHTLNTAAFNLAQLVASGHLDETDVITTLTDAALTAGLTNHETAATIRSGMRSGQRLPRNVDELPDLTEPNIEEVTLDELLRNKASQNMTASPSSAEISSAEERPPTSWRAQPAVERAAQQNAAPEPAFLTRADGNRLLYPGKINGIIGESESGKTWAAILAVKQALHESHRVLYLDFEDAAATLVERLRRLGVTDEQLDHLYYADPDTTLGALEQEDLAHSLTELEPALVVVDGANAAMSLLGLDLNSNTDATLFNRRLLKTLTAGGASVLTIDHVPKNAEQRGKGGIGAQAKRAMIDGCQIVAEVVKPFGLGRRGEIKLTIDKDRSGHVRGIAADARYLGKLIIDSTQAHATTMHIEPPLSDVQGSKPWQPTYLMEQISKLLEDAPDGLSGKELRDETKGRVEHIVTARDALIDGGWVSRNQRPGRGGGFLYVLLHPYREGDPEPVPTCSQHVPGTCSERCSCSCPPRSGTGTPSSPDQDTLQDELEGTGSEANR